MSETIRYGVTWKDEAKTTLVLQRVSGEELEFDFLADALTIDGVRFSPECIADLIRVGEAGYGPVVITRSDDTLTFRRMV